MNNYYFSPSTLAFYPEEIMALYEAAGTLPDDLVLVSDDAFATYSGTPPEGKTRGTSDKGLPAWVELPPLSHEEEVEAADAEKQYRIGQANEYINSKQWPGKAAMGRLKDTEKEQYNAWLDYLDALNAVDTSVAPGITWPIQPE